MPLKYYESCRTLLTIVPLESIQNKAKTDYSNKTKESTVIRKPHTSPPPPRPSLSALSIGHGKRVRLWHLLYGSGPANGTLLVLPLDQGLEHGPSDFFYRTRRRSTRIFSFAWRSRVATRPSRSASASPRSTCTATADGCPSSSSSTARRTSQTTATRFRRCWPASKTRCGWARTRWATRCTSGRHARTTRFAASGASARIASVSACRSCCGPTRAGAPSRPRGARASLFAHRLRRPGRRGSRARTS